VTAEIEPSWTEYMDEPMAGERMFLYLELWSELAWVAECLDLLEASIGVDSKERPFGKLRNNFRIVVILEEW
jgi:hypothetical protein